MNPVNPSNSKELLTLQEAATLLAVNVDVLLKWNEHNILKPTITQSGSIGYSKDQIDQFIIIRKLSSAVSSAEISPEPTIQYTTTEDYRPQTSTYATSKEFFTPRVTQTPPQSTPKSGSKFFPALIISSLTVFLFVVFVAVLLIQQSNFNHLTLQKKSAEDQKNVSLKSSNLPSERIIVALPIQLNNDDTTDDSSIKNETVSKDKITELTDLYTNTNQGSSSAKSTVTAIPTTTKARIAQLAAQISSNSALYKRAQDEATTVAYTSSTSCENCITQGENQKNSTIDSGGNILGETSKSTMLATSLGNLGNFSNENSSSNTSNSNVLIFLSVSALAGIFLLQKQLTQTMKNLQFAHSTSGSSSRIDFVAQKILEVEQKMDGTVMLIFQGTEYKICKPELYSESDRFIERLMALSGTDVKEMDYEGSKDGKIEFSSPLSRLVTRLGFVGIKRELFFPRTSKDRVLFRKYLTRDDLKTMGLTPEQVANELFNSEQNYTI